MSISPPQSIRPYLSVDDGVPMIEPLQGVSFRASAGRGDVFMRLQELVAQGACVATMSEVEGATLFHLAGPDEQVVLVFDDDTDQLLTIMPVDGSAQQLAN